MDVQNKLSGETIAQLEQRRANARRVIDSQPDTPRATEAEQLWGMVEAELAKRSLPGNIASFLEKYPEGFRDQKFLDKERDEKVAASETCGSSLSQSAFDSGLSSGQIDALLAAVKKLVNMTNLIQGKFEKPKLLDAVFEPKNSRPFLVELRDLLYGEGDSGSRLERFSDYLDSLGLRKWTYVTYFLFLSDPGNCIFVKPAGLKQALEITRYPLQYDSTPTAGLYRKIIEFSRWIEVHLRNQQNPDLVPKDMIDIQSFIWHIAPTGKFAKASP